MYEELIRRLAFKQDLAALGGGDEKKLAGPRYMQQTGEAKKKKLVLLKIGENNVGGGVKSTGGVGAGGGAGPPFFKQRMPIGDIIADVTAFTSDSGKTTTVTFYDSIYNCTASYSFPSCAMASLNHMKIAKKASGLGLGGGKAALGEKFDKRAESIKNLCSSIVVIRSEEEVSDKATVPHAHNTHMGDTC